MQYKKLYPCILLCFFLCFGSTNVFADTAAPEITLYSAPESDWWEVTPEAEVPSEHYDSILYSEIAPKLREIQLSTDRIQVEVMGQSAGGRNLFLVTMTEGKDMRRLNYYRRFIKTMSENPEKALQMIDNGADFKVPFYINSTIHGNEYGGVDACIRLIEALAYDNTPEVQAVLDNIILLINVIQNPDGRVLGTRANANGFDINRDFITQSQPESRATVKVINKWNPLTVLTLHDDMQPMLIEPCSPPHNPNFEYDLYIKWALHQALAMEAELRARTGFDAQIPFRDWVFEDWGWYWDDWPPIYDAMYPMYHGAFGHTIETPYEDERGVDAHYAVIWGALNFVVQNKIQMVQDHINIFWRGVNEQPQQLISEDILAESDIEQFNELTIQDFPAAYVIPVESSLQLSEHQPLELLDFLLFNGVKVEISTESFVLDGVTYPSGTYVVWLDQPKRGLANVMLEKGQDVSPLSEQIENLVFYSPPTAWSPPLLRGVHRVVMQEKMEIATEKVTEIPKPAGAVESGTAGAYAFKPLNAAAYQAANALINRGGAVYRSENAFADSGRTFGSGTFIIPADSALADELARDYALKVLVLSAVPENAVELKKQKIAVAADNGTEWALKSLGFDFDSITSEELKAEHIADYDLFINSGLAPEDLSDEGKTGLTAFFENGGDYIGIQADGIDFASAAGLTSAVYTTDWSADCIVNIDYDTANPVAAGFRSNDYAFGLYPVYFTEIPEGVSAVARIASEDSVTAGFWPGWQEKEIGGKAVILYETAGQRDVILIGIAPSFRAYSQNTFRLIGNAIFSSLD
ncbi:MAG: M14 family zinc carboxypeptidase [Desulfococcaceae bacterium]|nr:M14 family zinc carboxypeptidase [Desulfococcaceae bacterium]